MKLPKRGVERLASVPLFLSFSDGVSGGTGPDSSSAWFTRIMGILRPESEECAGASRLCLCSSFECISHGMDAMRAGVDMDARKAE